MRIFRSHEYLKTRRPPKGAVEVERSARGVYFDTAVPKPPTMDPQVMAHVRKQAGNCARCGDPGID